MFVPVSWSILIVFVSGSNSPATGLPCASFKFSTISNCVRPRSTGSNGALTDSMLAESNTIEMSVVWVPPSTKPSSRVFLITTPSCPFLYARSSMEVYSASSYALPLWSTTIGFSIRRYTGITRPPVTSAVLPIVPSSASLTFLYAPRVNLFIAPTNPSVYALLVSAYVLATVGLEAKKKPI